MMIRRLIFAGLLALAPSLASAQVNSPDFSVAAYVKYVLNGNVVIGGNLTVGGIIIDNTNGIVLNNPTGGAKGAGTINIAADYYKNGAVIPETVSSPLSLSALGVVSCPSCVLISGTAHGDSAYAILSTDRYVYTNAAFTAARTWTLPAANSVANGTTIWVQDAQGTVTPTNTLTIARAGTDTINIGSTSVVITGAAGGITFTSDGVSNWGSAVQTVTTGGTGRQTLTNHGVIVGAGANPVTQLAVGTTGTALLGVTGADPAFGSVVVSVKKQIFTASGTYTPSAGMLYAVIECVGSGGGGGSAAGTVGQLYAGGGGGSGSYSRLVASAATIGVSQTVTVGNAGTGGASGSNNGTAGSDVSVGTLCIGKGGSGGLFGANAQVGGGGAGGVAGTGDLAGAGIPGGPGIYNSSAFQPVFPAGSGGSSIFGGGAPGPAFTAGTAVAGSNATGFGSGGSGAIASNVAANAAGGNGSKGVVFITEYNSQ